MSDERPMGDTSPNDGKLRRLPAGVLHMRLRLAPECQHLVNEGLPPGMLSARLRALGLLREQLAFFAYALPEREAVWWGCMCVLHATPTELAPEQRHALALAQDWVRHPSEARRLESRAAAKAAGCVSPAAFVARAVFASQLARPASTRAGRLVEGAIRRAAASGAPERSEASLRRFIDSAEDIAEGGPGWLPPLADAGTPA